MFAHQSDFYITGNMDIKSHRKQARNPNADSSRYWRLRQDTQLNSNMSAIKVMHSHWSAGE
jgi:hypothetical protein